MGCVSSVFQFGSYLVQEGAEINEEQKEESNSEKDGVPVPSSPSQDTVVTIASSGSDKIQESPTKIAAPLAREEESFSQQASPVAQEIKVETKQGSEAKAGDIEAPEPEVKELQKVNETKLEKEKTVDTSGVTTEKTVYTQMSESVTIQETKGPAVDPFASSQKTVFPPFSKSWHEIKPQAAESQNSPSYVHSVKVTESSYPSPSSPVSVSSDAVTPEKAQKIHQSSETVSEKTAVVPEKIEVYTKTEVIEVATDAAENLSDSVADRSVSEKSQVAPASPSQQEPQADIGQEIPSSETELVYEEQIEEDTSERSDVEGAVVKIQAGIRGYLTRKALKESRKDGPLLESETGAASVQITSKQEVLSEEPLVLDAEEIEAVTDSLVKEIDEGDAAVKIQAVYRGYRTRKQLDELLNEPCDEEIETLNTSAEETESAVHESRRSPPDRSPVTVTENFVPILKTEITITPPSSPTTKKQYSSIILSSVEVTAEDSKAPATPEESGDGEFPVSETTDADDVADDNEDDESKKQAATKIQAAFRGYKVRKVSRKEASGNIKQISEETKKDTDLDFGSDDNLVLIPDAPEPVIGSSDLIEEDPLEPENDEDTLEEDADDDVDEIPNVQWQTSELYADDSSPEHMHQHEESKTESVAEEATAPVTDSPKKNKKSSEQVTLSMGKEDDVKSDH